MDEEIHIKYSKAIAFISIIIPTTVVIILSFITHLKNDFIPFIVFIGLFDIRCFFKFFLPMLNKKNALELNASGIHDFVRNQHASWDNVRGIKNFFDGNGPAIGVLLYNNKKFLNDKKFLRKFFIMQLTFVSVRPF